jgi:3-methyl-2-oxobutanoate hydroxymethyltransferase
MPNTVSLFTIKKAQKRPITMLTAYDFSTAKLFDQSSVDCLLVGDSMGMTILGEKTTLSVTLGDIIVHTRAVMRAAENAFVIADLPFGSYQISAKQAAKNAIKVVKKTGVHAVKLEGGKRVVKTVRKIVEAQIPVIGHLGLTPQSVNSFGGWKVQGKTFEAAQTLYQDALLLQEAGVTALVLECVPAPLAKFISDQLKIATIGIGSGAGCDGQVLVSQDMRGIYQGYVAPKFVQVFGNIGEQIVKATKDYCKAVESRDFPSITHEFGLGEEVITKLLGDKEQS